MSYSESTPADPESPASFKGFDYARRGSDGRLELRSPTESLVGIGAAYKSQLPDSAKLKFTRADGWTGSVAGTPFTIGSDWTPIPDDPSVAQHLARDAALAEQRAAELATQRLRNLHAAAMRSRINDKQTWGGAECSWRQRIGATNKFDECRAGHTQRCAHFDERSAEHGLLWPLPLTVEELDAQYGSDSWLEKVAS